MRLTKLHIINFGKLSDYTYNFEEGLNSFVFENGWGKTTLSNFIMAMLYGFNGNGRSINTNLRKKYTPWNNGVYGGSLEFKHNDKEYLIQRTFGSQSKDDQFVLYDLATNKVSNDYTSNIGFEILGLEYESFERSIYIPQKDLDLGFNEDLKSKLANIIGGTNDVQNYDKAIEIVSSRYKEIKKTSKSGKLIDSKINLEELEKEISVIESNTSALNVIKEDISNKETSLIELEEQRKKVFTDIEDLKKYEDYKKSLNHLNQHKKELEQLQNNLNEKESLLNNNSIEGLDDIKDKINELNKITIERDLLRKNNISNVVEEVITTDDLTDLENKITKYDEAKKATSRSSLFLGISMGLMVIGSVILVLLDFVFGGIIIGLGLVSSLIFGLIIGKNKKYKNNVLEEIKYILKKNDLDVIDINNSLNYLKIQKKQQIKTLENKVKYNDEINDLEIKIALLNTELANYFSKYALNSIDYKSKVSELERILMDIDRIKQQITLKENIINKFITENNLDVEVKEVTGDFMSLRALSDEINTKINLITQEKSRLIIRVSTYEEDLVRKEELINQKERLINDINNMERNYKLLKTTETLLKEANDSLLAKYVKPMKDRLNEYLSIVSNKNFFIDTDFNFTYEEDGIRREIDYYSKGIQQIVVLCMRFALIDCMYQDNKPFIILDDSFVDFDKNNLEYIKDILNKLKNNYQIIYFTCHESRMM